MPRKGPAPRRDLVADPIYHSVLVTQLVNKVMLHGKRSLAERTVYEAMDIMATKSGDDSPGRLQAGRRQRQAAAGGQEPPCRWCHLPGARRGPPPPLDDPRLW